MFEECFKKIENIEGWFSKDDAFIFFEAIKNLKNKGAMVEIGSWCGRSLIFSYLVSSCFNNHCKKFSIDPFLTSKDVPNGKYETFLNNIKQYNLEDKIIHIKEKSNDAGLKFKDDIEFLFIDGFHKYDYIKKDFELFYKKVVFGGYILIHDVSTWLGPTQLVYELGENSNNIQLLKFAGRTVLTKKVERLTNEDKLKNSEIIAKIRERIANAKIQLAI